MAKRAGRASNGMGSIRKRKDGLWEARYTAPDGRQHSLYAKTEAEVTKKLRAALHDLDNGTWRREPSRMTFAEWLDVWLRDYQAHTSPRTVEIYSDFARLHIRPVIGDVRLTDLKPMHIRRVINAMTEKGLSANYIHHCHGVMSVALNAAIEAGMIKVNPAAGMRTPRVVKKPLTIVDRDRIADFVAAAERQPVGAALVFMLLTGLRAGEMRGLQWDDVDLDNGSMRIVRQIPSSGVIAVMPPKDGSTRTVELTPEAVALLRRQRVAQDAARLAAGEKWEENELTAGLVFRSARGHFVAESVLHKAARAVGAAIGLPGLHPHDLRHSYAVAALRSGVDVKTLQHNLGHRSASMTLDVYAAYTQDAGKTGAARMSEYLKSAFEMGEKGNN